MGTRKIQELPPLILSGAFAVINDDVAARRAAGLIVHEDFPASGDLVAADVAADTETAIVRLNELKAKYNAHRVKTAAHKAADTTNATSAADATDEASGITLANELKTDFNAHHKSATFHHVGGAGGAAVAADVSTADASNEATLVALANALVDAYHRHVSSGAPTLVLVAS